MKLFLWMKDTSFLHESDKSFINPLRGLSNNTQFSPINWTRTFFLEMQLLSYLKGMKSDAVKTWLSDGHVSWFTGCLSKEQRIPCLLTASVAASCNFLLTASNCVFSFKDSLSIIRDKTLTQTVSMTKIMQLRCCFIKLMSNWQLPPVSFPVCLCFSLSFSFPERRISQEREREKQWRDTR